MATRKAKPARKSAKKPAARPKPVKPKSRKIEPLDLSDFPPESISAFERWICLACVSDIFLRHLDLAPRTAHLEIKRYTPSLPELYAPVILPSGTVPELSCEAFKETNDEPSAEQPSALPAASTPAA